MILRRLRRSAACRCLPTAVAALSIWGGGPARAAGILFLDRCVPQCDYHEGSDNSITNASSIISGSHSLNTFTHGDAAWAELLACVQATYAPYDITVTDVDPGAVAHWEVPVAGTPTELGFPDNTAGVSPFTCGVINNGVAFSFANIHDNMKELCWTTAHEGAHLLGLDHQLLVRDPMTYISGCLEKRFTSEAAPCGENSPRACTCGGATQNSDAKVAAALGRAATGAPLFRDGLSVSETGLDELGSTCQWTSVSGEALALQEGATDGPVKPFRCGTEERLLELSRIAPDAVDP